MAEDPDELSLKAQSSLRENDVPGAIGLYRRLLALHPGRASDWFNLGWALRRDRQFEEALSAYAKAVEHGITDAEEAHLNRAIIFSDDLNRPDHARAELEQALELRPEYVPALLNLGNLREDEGDREGALQAYAQALAADPANVLALARTADVTRFDSSDNELLDRLRSVFAKGGLLPNDRADIGFALGRALDQVGAFVEAFQTYKTANDASARARFRPYQRGAASKLIEALVKAFDRPCGAETLADAPIFICGMFRSGSTLAERVLAQHPLINAGGELTFIPEIVAGISGYPQGAAALSQSDLAKLFDTYERRAIEAGYSLKGLTDKRPDNFLHIGLIKQIFPTAKIVNTVRDTMDNVLSIYFAHLGPQLSYATNLADIAHWMAEYERLMEHWRALYPDDIFELDYDALVRDPESTIRSLLNFLGLEWEEACLEPHGAKNLVRTASAWQVREPLHTQSSGRWKNYRAQLEFHTTALKH